MKRESIKTIVEKISLPCRDNGISFTDTRRLDAIAKCVKGRWKLLINGHLAKIYHHPDFDPAKPVVVVSSHVDMVANRCYADCNGELWHGSFDNMITNAAVVYNMTEMGFIPNVLVAFTGDEEEDSRGADQVIAALQLKNIKIDFVIVTDVTEVGWNAGKHFTIENIFPDDGQSVATLLSKWLPTISDIDNHPKIVVEAECDEAWQYDEHDMKCCSVCLPCHGDMHSEEGVSVRSDSVAIYAEVLQRLTSFR